MTHVPGIESRASEMQTVDLNVPVAVQHTVDPETTLVVVVDIENEFCDPAGSLYLGPEAEQAVGAAQSLLQRARRAGCRVVWVRSVRDESATEFDAYGVPPHLIRDSWAVKYTPPLAPLPDEAVIEKWSHDCFNQTGLDAWLDREHVFAPTWMALIIGVALHVCVDHAVLGFSVRGYRVGVVLDCVAPRSGPAAAATLWRYGEPMYRYNVSVTSSDLLRL